MPTSLANPQSVGGRVRIARDNLNLNQVQVCELSGVAESTLKKIESGATKSPRTKTLELLAKVLGVPAGFLRTGEQPPATDCAQGII